jgi:hypothetical protein
VPVFCTAQTPGREGKVSFDLRWFGELNPGNFKSTDHLVPFEMEFVQTNVHISSSGQTGSDHFHTTAGAQEVGFAQIANERNGSFFGTDEDDDDD